MDINTKNIQLQYEGYFNTPPLWNENKMNANEEFAKNPRAQLDYIYKNSPYFETVYLKLPVYKVF